MFAATNGGIDGLLRSLDFDQIGRIPGPVTQLTTLVSMHGRHLPQANDDEVRFDMIRFYLAHQTYPKGADKSERSRLRSFGMRYYLEDGREGQPRKLMMEEREVIANPGQQTEIVRSIHIDDKGTHLGINKTTAVVAEKYHWTRIKDTVQNEIKNCPVCRPGVLERSESGRRSFDLVAEAEGSLLPLESGTLVDGDLASLSGADIENRLQDLVLTYDRNPDRYQGRPRCLQ